MLLVGFLVTMAVRGGFLGHPVLIATKTWLAGSAPWGQAAAPAAVLVLAASQLGLCPSLKMKLVSSSAAAKNYGRCSVPSPGK